jgi:superfamily I DNA and/or RNA helicase/very-short-patch-repair endonuclease
MLNTTIECQFEYDEKVSFALQQNHVPVVKFLSVKNTSADYLSNLKIEITGNPMVAESYSLTIEKLEPDKVLEIRPDLQLSSEFLRSLDESISGHLNVSITHENQELFKKTFPIEVMSFDSWPGASVLPEIISSFITPNRPFINEIIRKAATIMEKGSGSNSMDGYQSGNPNMVLAQLSAIFSAIQSYGIAYVNPPASFEEEGQKVRFPDLIKEHKLGTCLDLTLLYAACAEAVGIYPIVVFLQGHAFPAFWLKEQTSFESFQDDKSILTKSMAGGINELIVVESTLLTKKEADFKGAVQAAEMSLDKEGQFHFFIDVQRSRIGQIKPIPLKKVGGEIEVEVQTETELNTPANMQFAHVEVIPESEKSHQINEQENKVIYWQNKLIDMSLRNNLLNYRLHTQGVPVVTPDLSKTEDLLAMGQKVFINPLPNEWKNKARDFRDQKELLQSKILQGDMQNNRLRSTLTEVKLEQELVKLYRKAKNTLEESGANSLFVALGFLKWYEEKSYTTERYAPILLLPVDLVRLSAKKGYYIRARDEEIQINISLIEYLKQKFGIDASRLYDIPKDDHGADVKRVLTTMRRLIMPMKNWDVYETASIGLFSFSKFVMWNDLVNNSEELKKNKVVKSLIEGNYLGEDNQTMNKPVTAEVDEEETVFAPLSFDSTQLEAILAAGDNNSFVLHGPPGSGKSQTITNMISHALANDKTVLFVAEKMAALSVVQKRLSDIGLGDFCLEVYSSKGQKRDILAQLEASFKAQSKTKGTKWNEKSEEIKRLKKELNTYVHDLHKKTTIGQSIFEMIEEYSDIKVKNQVIEFNRNSVKEMDEELFKKSKRLLENIAVVGEICGDTDKNPWIGIKQTNYSLQLNDTIKEQLSNIETNVSLLEELEQSFNTLGLVNQHRTYEWYSLLDSLSPYLQNIPQANLNLIGVDHFEQFISQLTDIITTGKQRDSQIKTITERFDLSILKINPEPLLQDLRLAENSWFLKKIIGKNKISKELKKYLVSKDKIDSAELETIITAIKEIQQKQETLDQSNEIMERYFPDLWNESKGSWLEIEKALEWTVSVRSALQEFNEEQYYLTHTAEVLQNNTNAITAKMQDAIKNYELTFKEIKSRVMKIEEELILSNFHEPGKPDWTQVMKDKSQLLTKALPQLKDNCQLARTIEEAELAGLENVTKPYLNGQLKHSELLPAFLHGFYRVRIDEEITSSQILSGFSRAEFENKVKTFNSLDDEISELTKLEVYVRLMERVPDLLNNVIQSSEPGILLKAIKSKGRGIAIRQLFERIPNLLPKIKPCMLMSPLSVAQYLDPSVSKFDFVIFDEASQLPTSEAIGAMARGENVVVVGDPKQLPPTSFFSAQQSEEDFDIQDLESVLDDCLSVRMPQKHLSWHYRSEHESLISFSNNHFYENKLITFPSVDDIKSRVSFKNVKGVYDRGKTNHNKIEAKAIVDEIFTRLSNPKQQHQSIGVVTFNQVQQTLIEDMIDERLKEDSSLEKYFTDEVLDPVFVKNLENVQGDERDVILFSVGYGPDETGHMTLNFGPLNRDGGWRRLNVAVSRAKKEMIIYASMEPDQINLSRTKAEGVHSLRAFMEFAKRGNEPLLLENRSQSKNANSAIIIPKIQEALETHGYQTQQNVGSSEFKIDLAVVDKNREGKYIAAIQIDGPGYANRKTARDRNKLSDLMLGRLGWQVIKVWSVEWWHDESKQIEGILNQLKHIEKNPPKENGNQPVASAKVQPTIQQKISSLVIPVENTKPKGNFFEPAILEGVDLPNETFYTLEGRPIIQKQIQQIIDQEAPVSLSQLTKSIISAWGFTRSGAKLETIIETVLSKMNIYKSKEEKGLFLWKDETQFNTYKEFRLAVNDRRALQDISKQEFANGVMEIINTALRLPKADLIKEMSKQLGYSRTSSQGEQFIQEAIDLNVRRDLVVEDEKGFVEVK